MSLLLTHPGAVCTPELSAVDVATSIVRGVRDRLAELTARVRTVSAAADWQSSGARAFHERTEELSRDLDRVEVAVDEIIDMLRQARAEAEVRAVVGA